MIYYIHQYLRREMSCTDLSFWTSWHHFLGPQYAHHQRVPGHHLCSQYHLQPDECE